VNDDPVAILFAIANLAMGFDEGQQLAVGGVGFRNCGYVVH
jgi:hypothetical protein